MVDYLILYGYRISMLFSLVLIGWGWWKGRPYPVYLGAALAIPVSLYLAALPIFLHVPLLFPPLIVAGAYALKRKKRQLALRLFLPYLLLAGYICFRAFVLNNW